MAPRVKLSKKQQAEFDILKQRFRITKKEYKEYYDEVRKANRKLQALSRGKKLIDNYGVFTTKVDNIKSRKDFTKRMTKVQNVRQRDFRYEWNRYKRETFKKTFIDVYASDNLTQVEIDELDRILNSLNDTDLRNFVDNNPELIPYFRKYAQMEIKKNIAEYGDIDKDTLINRLKYHAKNIKTGKGRYYKF